MKIVKMLNFSTIHLVKETKSAMANSPGLLLHRFDNIIQSEEDKRSYRGLVLSNQMKVLLVSDSNTDKSAAAMDVNVGKFFATFMSKINLSKPMFKYFHCNTRLTCNKILLNLIIKKMQTAKFLFITFDQNL